MQTQKVWSEIEALNINSALTDEIIARKKQLCLKDKDLMALTGFARSTIKNVLVKQTALYKDISNPGIGSCRLKTILAVCEKLGIEVRIRILDYHGILNEEVIRLICRFCVAQGANSTNMNSVFIAQAKYYTGASNEKPKAGYGVIRMLHFYEQFGGLYKIEVTHKDAPSEIPPCTIATGGGYKVRPVPVASPVINTESA